MERIIDTLHFVKTRELMDSLETFDMYSKTKKQIKPTKNLQQGPINSTMSKYNMRTTDVDLDYGARVPTHSLQQSHPNSP
jgi:hypothetical protein